MRKVIVGVAAVCLIAGGTRVAAQSPTAAAWLVGSISVLAVGVGVAVNERSHAGRWRRGWWLLWVALAARATATVVEALAPVGWDVFPSGAHALQLIGAVAAVAGVDQLMRHRHPGRAADVLFESAVAATLAALAAWLIGIEPRTPLPAGDAVHLFSLVLVGLGVAAVWTTVRLIWLTEDHPAAYRYLAVGLVCLLTVDAVSAGSLIADWTFAARYQSALELWACILWAAGALHPSLRASFDPVPSRPDNLRRTRATLVLAAVVVGPTLAAVQALRGSSLRFGVVLVAAVVVPLLVIVELMRQVRERATREYLAQHDALTGLPNRVLFHDRLEITLAHARRSGDRAAVMFLDLDRFKEVNDSLGHDVGNQLLQGVARRLRRCLRDHDTVARLGGDEFTILLTKVDGPDDCVVVAEKVLRAFREPFPVTGRQLYAGASIGVAIYPDDGVDAETLLKNADTAMYRAKARGRSSYDLYTKEMSARAEVRHSLESSLHRAIQRQELALHYQPKVRRIDGRVLGVEALVRWEHPRLGSIPPSAFIPLAEESGLILPLGEWVLGEACRQAAEWSGAGLTRMTVAVNVSARQFAHEPLEDIVRGVLEQSGLDPTLLELELTESVFLRDLNAVTNVMQRLHDMGVRCSIDDFGTGFSGLSYLNRMPINALKIDRSFVREIRAGADAPIVTAMISMAKSLALGVVAEGVETEAQAQFLLDHGCDEMQGFLFSRPLPAVDLERLLMTEQGFLRGVPVAAAGAVVPPLHAGGAFGPGVAPPIDPAALVTLLETACAHGETLAVDPGLVEAVLAALREDQLALAVRQWGSKSLPVRLAAGTFAGLIPLSGGLVAADALPGAAQTLALRAFSSVGVELPHVAAVDGDSLILASPPPAASTPRGPKASKRRGGGGADRPPVDADEVALPVTLVDREGEHAAAPPAADPGSRRRPARRRAPAQPAPAPVTEYAPPAVDVAAPPPGREATPPATPPVAPGRDGTPPGQSETPPGQSGTPPGQSETPPGNGGGAQPGNGGGAQPGNGGTQPGNGGTQPGNGGGGQPGNGGGGQPGNGGGTQPGNGGTQPGTGGGAQPGNGGGTQPGTGGGTQPGDGGGAQPGDGGGTQPGNGGETQPGNGGTQPGGDTQPGNGGAQPGNGGGAQPGNGGAQPGSGGGTQPGSGGGTQPGNGGTRPGNGGTRPGSGGGAQPGSGGGAQPGNGGGAQPGNGGGAQPGSGGGGAQPGQGGSQPGGGAQPGTGGGASAPGGNAGQ